MKEKLKKFKSFASTILPHEATYLLSIQRFEDEEKKQILRQLEICANSLTYDGIFDTEIDKRKYSSIQSWVKMELAKIDVDEGFIWINGVMQDILLDRVTPKSESMVLKSLQLFDNTSYYFTKYYDMLLEFRQFLLIRMRTNVYKKVDRYINGYQFEYQRSLLVSQQMDQATKEIIGLTSKMEGDDERWERWLLENFNNDDLDGHNRYLAFVRLSYHYLKTNQLAALEQTHTTVQKFFEHGKHYSRRLLLNFYDNSLVLYDRKEDYDQAQYYGRLSIKGEGPDQLLYFNNFINILIKKKEFAQALEWISNRPYKITDQKNYHSVIGYTANHIRCLTKTGLIQKAVNKGDSFWTAFPKQIMEYRWHRFFVAFLEALAAQGNTAKIIKLVSRLHLIDLELENVKRDQAANRPIFEMYRRAIQEQ